MSIPDEHPKRLNLKPGEYGHLSDLRKRGQKAIVIDFHNDNAALRRHLLDMGITKGVVVEVKKIAPLGDPIDIKLRGYELALAPPRHDGHRYPSLGR
jgi:ferrous iron transport protein A